MSIQSEIHALIGQQKNGFTDADLAKIRENINDVAGLNDRVLNTRMTIELIETIRRLDKTSAELIKKTNGLTGVGVAVAFAGVLVALMPFLKR